MERVNGALCLHLIQVHTSLIEKREQCGVEGAEKWMLTSFYHKQDWSNAGLLQKNLGN